jgi:hypothetical protein
MINKKGQGISLNFLIIAALALVTLIIIALFFTGGIQKIFKKQSDVVIASEQEISLARANCQFLCVTGVKTSYDNPPFTEPVIAAGYKNCETLLGSGKTFDEVCGKCITQLGATTTADCATKDTKSSCPAGCKWVPN